MTTTNEVMRLATAFSFLEPGSEHALRTAVEALVAERDALKAALLAIYDRHTPETMERARAALKGKP